MSGRARQVRLNGFNLGPWGAVSFPWSCRPGGREDTALLLASRPPVRLANIYLSPLHACSTLWALSIMLFQPWFLGPFCVARLFRVVLEAMGSEDLDSTSLAFAFDLLDEYQSLLLEFLYADLGIVLCLMVLWGAQILSSWWP